MSNIVSFFSTRDSSGPLDLFEGLSDTEQGIQVLKDVFPRLCNDIAMLVCRPFRLIWDPTIQTASTDCLAEVRMAPWFFLNGLRDVGFGTGYHEAGHIVASPYCTRLLGRACKEGGYSLQHIMNIILDRKDDMITARRAPGFALTLWKRLAYICTMARREQIKEKLESGVNKEIVTQLLKNWKPGDVYEDFFFAAKWHKRARFKATHRAMRYLRRERLLKASEAELLWIGKRVREILGKAPESERKQGEQALAFLMLLSLNFALGASGGRLDPKLERALRALLQQYVAVGRQGGLSQLVKLLKNMGLIYPGPISVGIEATVPLEKVAQSSNYVDAYNSLLAEVSSYVQPLVQKLRRVDNPSQFTLYGREEGELDLSESARIATGLPGIYEETVVERDIDAELHFALDNSGSMDGAKLQFAKKIGVVFSEAIRALSPIVVGRTWGFNSLSVKDFGAPGPHCGFVTLEGADNNSDTHMLRYVGTELAKSRKRRRILLVLCDDGPDSIQEASKLSHQLLARGIIVIHLLVGVHGTPDIYPIELVYTSMEECFEEFPSLLELIIKNLR